MLQVHQQATTSMLIWSLWKSRTSKLWERVDTSPSHIIQHANDTLHEWRVCKKQGNQLKKTQGTHQEVSWIKRPHSTVKCNMD